MIVLKSEREINLIHDAGKILIAVFDLLQELIKPGVTTMYLNNRVEELIKRHQAIPTFKGLYGFPYATCISVNDTLIHGFPSKKCLLKEGDIVSIDVGATLKGYIADAARTYMVGEVSEAARRLVEVTEESFFQAVALIKPGVHLGDISQAIQSYCEQHGYSVSKDYTGHGVGLKLHEDPTIPNYGEAGTGPLLQAGMVLAIEPMVNAGSAKTHVLKDGWSVKTDDGALSAHYENSVAVTRDGYRILTLKERKVN